MTCVRWLFVLSVLGLMSAGCFRSHGLSGDGPGGSDGDGGDPDGGVRFDGHVRDGTPTDHYAHANTWPSCSPGSDGEGCGRAGFGTSPEWCICHPVCRDASDCPEPEGASMDAVCLNISRATDQGGCHLRCESDADCPDGMRCLRHRDSPINECVFDGS